MAELVLVGAGSNRVYRYANGAWDAGIATPGILAKGVAIDPANGDILIVTAFFPKVYRYANGAWDAGIATPDISPTGITVNPADGDIFLVGRHENTDVIYRYAAGAWAAFAEASVSHHLVSAEGIAIDPANGDILLASTGVFRYANGAWDSGIPLPSGVSVPTGIAVDPDNGDIALLDNLRPKIYRYANGAWDSGMDIPTGEGSPQGLAFLKVRAVDAHPGRVSLGALTARLRAVPTTHPVDAHPGRVSLGAITARLHAVPTTALRLADLDLEGYQTPILQAIVRITHPEPAPTPEAPAGGDLAGGNAGPIEVTEGSLELASDLIITEIERRSNDTPGERIQFRHQGAGNFQAYFDDQNAGQQYPNAKLIVHTLKDGVLSPRLTYYIVGTGTNHNNWRLDEPAQAALTNALTAGDTLGFAIAEPHPGEAALAAPGRVSLGAMTARLRLETATGAVDIHPGRVSLGALTARLRAVAISGAVDAHPGRVSLGALTARLRTVPATQVVEAHPGRVSLGAITARTHAIKQTDYDAIPHTPVIVSPGRAALGSASASLRLTTHELPPPGAPVLESAELLPGSTEDVKLTFALPEAPASDYVASVEYRVDGGPWQHGEFTPRGIRPQTTAEQDRTDAFLPDGWTAQPQGVDERWQNEYVSVRFGQPGEWEKFSLPVLTYLFGITGADGEDGLGVEYIFARTAEPTIAAGQRPNNEWGFDEPGDMGGLQWHDGAPFLTDELPYLWRAQRRTVGAPESGDEVIERWSMPAIVGRYGLDGPEGDRGIKGADGTDGMGVEYIFAVTTGGRPSNPNNAWGYDSPSPPWFDGAPNLTATNNTLWRSQRAVQGSPAIGDQVPANWTAAAIVGRYGDRGASRFNIRVSSLPTTPSAALSAWNTGAFIGAQRPMSLTANDQAWFFTEASGIITGSTVWTWNGSQFVTQDEFIDGNLIINGSVTAEKAHFENLEALNIKVRNLDVLDGEVFDAAHLDPLINNARPMWSGNIRVTGTGTGFSATVSLMDNLDNVSALLIFTSVGLLGVEKSSIGGVISTASSAPLVLSRNSEGTALTFSIPLGHGFGGLAASYSISRVYGIRGAAGSLPDPTTNPDTPDPDTPDPDGEPPDIPLGFGVSSTANNVVSFTWRNLAQEEEQGNRKWGTGTPESRLYRLQIREGTTVVMETTRPAGTAVAEILSYLFQNVAPGSYSCRIRAETSAGRSNWTDSMNVTVTGMPVDPGPTDPGPTDPGPTDPDPTDPDPPTPVAPSTPGNFTVAANGDNMTFSWSAAAWGNGTSGSRLFRLQIRQGGTVVSETTRNASASSYTFQNVSPGVYTCRMRAETSAGNSAWTPQRTITIASAPPLPSTFANVSVTVGNVNVGAVSFYGYSVAFGAPGGAAFGSLSGDTSISGHTIGALYWSSAGSLVLTLFSGTSGLPPNNDTLFATLTLPGGTTLQRTSASVTNLTFSAGRRFAWTGVNLPASGNVQFSFQR